MLRKLVLFFILICSTGIAYGQHDYQITEKDISGKPFIYIESKNRWERRRAFTLDKTPYRWNIYDREYWKKKVNEMRQSYIPPTILQKMVESKTQITIDFIADYRGNMIDIYLYANSRILNLLSKEQLIEIYKKIWTVKVCATEQLTKDQYFRGQFFLKPMPKQDSDESKLLEQLMQLKRRQSSPTK